MDMNLANSRRQWGTESPGVLQSMRLQSQTRLGNWTMMIHYTLQTSRTFPRVSPQCEMLLWTCFTENACIALKSQVNITSSVKSSLTVQGYFFSLSSVPTALNTGFHYDNCCPDRTVCLVSMSTLECAGRAGLFLLGLPSLVYYKPYFIKYLGKEERKGEKRKEGSKRSSRSAERLEIHGDRGWVISKTGAKSTPKS